MLSRGVAKIVGEASIRRKLTRRRKLRIKHGVDPTTPDLHLGHAAIYEKLRVFQRLGHTIIFIIGDFTGRFGDPTDTLHARSLRTKREVRRIAKSYLTQLRPILDLRKTEVHYNSEWYDRMKAEDLLRIFSHFTVGRMMERDMFQERVRRSLDIRLHEILYPALQAYDSAMIQSDLTIIGSDQLFNEIQGRKIQREFNQKSQDIIALNMLVGLDGVRKMSQSLGNYVGVTESADAMYGKIMSLPDFLIYPYFELVTRVSSHDLTVLKRRTKNHPHEAKLRLAREIATIYHGSVAAKSAEKEFIRVFRERKFPSRVATVTLTPGSYSSLDLLVRLRLVPSKSEAKRLIEQRAFKVNDETITDWKRPIRVEGELHLQLGKKRFLRVTPR